MTLRRGVGFVFALIGLAVVVSVAALVVLYVSVRRRLGRPRAGAVDGRARAAPRRRAARAARPTTWWGSSSIAATTACGRWSSALRRAKTDPRITSVVLMPGSLDSPYWARLQELRDAVLDFRRSGQAGDRVSRIRRRPRVLPGQRRRQGLPAADELARSHRHRQLRDLPARRRSTRSAPIRTSSTSATTRPPPTSSPKPA